MAPPPSSKPSTPPRPAAKPVAVAKPIETKKVDAKKVEPKKIEKVEKKETIELRPKNKDESGIVAVRSLQPTLPGIGPDDEVDIPMSSMPMSSPPETVPMSSPFGAPSVAPTSIPVSVAVMSAPVSAPATTRDANPTMIEELDVSALMEESAVEEGRASTPTPPIPLLRIAPQQEFAPMQSHVPPPIAQAPVAPVVSMVQPVPAPLGHVAPRQMLTPVPSPAHAFVPMAAPAIHNAPPVTAAPVAAQPAPAAMPRPSLSDPMDLLFDAAYDLCFLQSAVEGATHAMNAGVHALGARAGLVHLIDGNTGEFVTVAGTGTEGERQILSRHEDDDWLLSAAVFKNKPLTMEYGGEVSGRPMPRHAALGVTNNVIIVPIIAWGRPLGVIEIVDAHESMLAGACGENALAYLSQRLAEFLGEHEIVLGVA